MGNIIGRMNENDAARNQLYDYSDLYGNNDQGSRGRNYVPNQTGRDPREDYFLGDPVGGVPDPGAQPDTSRRGEVDQMFRDEASQMYGTDQWGGDLGPISDDPGSRRNQDYPLENEGYEIDEGAYDDEDITDPDYDDGYGEQVGPAFGEGEEEWYRRRRAENMHRQQAWGQ